MTMNDSMKVRKKKNTETYTDDDDEVALI